MRLCVFAGNGPMSFMDRARQLYHRLPEPPSTNYSVRRTQIDFWRQCPPGSVVYDIGSKGQDEIALDLIPPGTKLISVDIDPDAKPDIVGDVHDLHMIPDNSADGVFTSSVLEHVRDPWKAV